MASFDENGKYIKTNWKAGDKITATKLNMIEESIEAVNDNDISRHVEADARLDALEAKDVAHDKELTNIKNTIADNKAAAELGDYEINSRMTFLENELNEGIAEVNNVASTVDGKIATAEANMTTQVNQGKADMEAMVAEVEVDLEGLHAKDEELSAQLADITSEILDDFSNIKSNQTFHLEYNKEYILNETINFDDVNNIRINGNNATIRVKEGNIGFLFNEYCENIVIENLNFISDNTDIETVAIAFMSIDNNYDKNSACKNIRISNCKFLGGFSVSIVANVVTNLTVNNCYFTSNKYLGIEAATGGYGILTQTCYNVNIFNNEFIASPTDRHAIYISCFSLTDHVMQQNENVRIYNNIINWLLADAGTQHENAITIRSTRNCYIYDNTILGGWGSIAVNPSHGDCSDIKIHHNICKYVKGSSEFDLFGIGSIKADKGHDYQVVNLEISNNYITCEGERTSPITIVDTSFFNVSNNTCIQQSTGGSVVITDSIYGNINGNYLEGKSGYSYGIGFRGTLNEYIQTGNNTFKNNVKENIIQDNSSLNNFKFDGTRKVKIDTNGSSYVVGLEDQHNILSSVTGVDNGCIIEFSKFVDVYNSSFSVAYSFGDVPITYVKIENSNSIRVVMKNFNGDNISCSTSAVTFTVTVSS